MPGRRHRGRGFTFIELMFVVAIIGVLASIALPNFLSFQTKAKLSEAYLFADEARGPVLDFYAHRGVWPKDNREAGLLPPEAIQGKYVESLQVVDGAIAVRLRGVRDYPGVRFLPAPASDWPGAPVIWTREYIRPGTTASRPAAPGSEQP